MDVTGKVGNGPCLISQGPANGMSAILIRLYFNIPLTLILTVGLSLSLLTRGKMTTTNLITLRIKGLHGYWFKHILHGFLQLLLIPLAPFWLLSRQVEMITVFLAAVIKRFFALHQHVDVASSHCNF